MFDSVAELRKKLSKIHRVDPGSQYSNDCRYRFIFANDPKYHKIVPQLEWKLFNLALKQKQKKLLIWIVIGQGYSLSLAPNIYKHVDVIIYLDCNKHVLDCIKFQYEVFPSAKNLNDFYIQLLKKYTPAKNISDKGLYIGNRCDQYGSFNEAIKEHKDGASSEYCGNYHCSISNERFKECQSAVKDNAKKTIFLNMDICNPKALSKLNKILSGEKYKLAGITLTNLARWLSGFYSKITSQTCYYFGDLLYARLPIAKNVMIVSSIWFSKNCTYIHRGLENYWRNYILWQTLDNISDICFAKKLDGQRMLGYLQTKMIFQLIETKEHRPSVINIRFKNFANTIKNKRKSNAVKFFPEISKHQYIKSEDTIFHLIARSTQVSIKLRENILKMSLGFLQYEWMFGRKTSLNDMRNANGESPLDIKTDKGISRMFKFYEKRMAEETQVLIKEKEGIKSFTQKFTRRILKKTTEKLNNQSDENTNFSKKVSQSSVKI